MQTSARNAWEGHIGAVVKGEVNAEIEVALPGGERIVAVVTESSRTALGLAVGRPVRVHVKAPWVMLMVGDGKAKSSARNQLAGVVDSLRQGAVNSDVALRLAGGTLLHAVVTNDAVRELGLKPGAAASALIKASHVVLGVPA